MQLPWDAAAKEVSRSLLCRRCKFHQYQSSRRNPTEVPWLLLLAAEMHRPPINTNNHDIG
jgi:hypothetical protein